MQQTETFKTALLKFAKFKNLAMQSFSMLSSAPQSGVTVKGGLWSYKDISNASTDKTWLFSFQYNPEILEDVKELNWNELSIPGRVNPIIGFSHGKARKVDLRLLLDCAEDFSSGMIDYSQAVTNAALNGKAILNTALNVAQIASGTNIVANLPTAVDYMLAYLDELFCKGNQGVTGAKDTYFTSPPILWLVVGSYDMDCVVTSLKRKRILFDSSMRCIRAEIELSLMEVDISDYKEAAQI